MSDEIVRLIGDGDRASGGSVPLPDAFIAVTEELLDNGPATFKTLNGIVSDVLAYKETRILACAWRTWEDFTQDILTRLTAINVIEKNRFGLWEVTDEFVPGRRYEAFPGRSSIGFTARDKATREVWNDNSGALLKLRPILTEIRERYPKANPQAVKYLMDAEEILRDDLEMRKIEEHKINRRDRKIHTGIRRGDPQWRQLTGQDMPSPTKTFTAKYVMNLPQGQTFTESMVTAWVGEQVAKLEAGIPELVDLSPVGSSTVSQALHGKDHKSGLLGEGFIERLPVCAGRPNISYRRL
jgi:hypothetical protein